MSNNLFDDLPESLSPRLAWMRKNDIEVIDCGIDHEPGDKCEFTGNRLYQYWAVMAGTTSIEDEAGGDTEDDAIVTLAKKRNLKLWNE